MLNAGDGRLLGATVVAPTGGELIHEAAQAMHARLFTRQGDATEPWMFLVGADGTIVQRWDNVATEASHARAAGANVGG